MFLIVTMYIVTNKLSLGTLEFFDYCFFVITKLFERVVIMKIIN